jgi:hypothetical protein
MSKSPVAVVCFLPGQADLSAPLYYIHSKPSTCFGHTCGHPQGRCSFIFLQLSKQMPEQYLKLGHGGFLACKGEVLPLHAKKSYWQMEVLSVHS